MLIQAIETTYRGARFRSRLEARWAAFFDKMAWKWDYEPFDCQGYIPDFVVQWDKPTCLEVKPEVTTGGLLRHVQKLEASGLLSEHPDDAPYVLPAGLDVGIVGATLRLWATTEHCDWLDLPLVGLVHDAPWCHGTWADLRLHTCGKCSHGIATLCGTWRCLVCGEPPPSEHDFRIDSQTASDFALAWNEAGSIVQWRPARRAA